MAAKATSPATRSDSGSILLVTALVLVILLGFLALAVDASFMYDVRNRLHATADAAAKSAAIEVRRGNAANIDEFARQAINQQVLANQLPSTALVPANRIVRLCSDPSATCTAPYAGNANYVEVILSLPTGTFFARVLGLDSMTPGARAVAGFAAISNPACLIALGPPSGSNPVLTTSGNVTVNAPGCAMEANGNVGMNGNNTVTAATLTANGNLVMGNPTRVNVSSGSISGTCSGGGPSCNTVQAGMPPASITDPLFDLAEPTPPGSCTAAPSGATIGPPSAGGVVCYSSFSRNGGTTTLLPGTYYLTGGASFGGNSVITGTGVTLFFHTGSLTMNGNAQLNVSGPTSGPYEGIAIYQRRGNSTAPSQGGTTDLNVNGIIYTPSANLLFYGTNGNNDCSIVIARTVTFSGTPDFANTCATYGGSPLPGVGGPGGNSVALAE